MSNATPAPLRDCVCLNSGHCWACIAAGRRCPGGCPRMKCADGRACGSRVAPAMPRPVLEDGTSDESIPPAVRYCPDCGNCDCPNVASDPYWKRCPATDRVRRPAPPAPRVCTTSEGLEAALRASIAWASRPVAVHAANRALDVDAPAILTPRVADLDRHERAFVTRRTRRSMRGAA